MTASTIDREFKALVDLFNQTTGGPRDVYRGAFEGHLPRRPEDNLEFRQGDGRFFRGADQGRREHGMGGCLPL